MRKGLKWLKRLLKVALVVIVVLVVSWLLGVFNWLGSFFGFLPGIPLPWLNGIENENAGQGDAHNSSKIDAEMLKHEGSLAGNAVNTGGNPENTSDSNVDENMLEDTESFLEDDLQNADKSQLETPMLETNRDTTEPETAENSIFMDALSQTPSVTLTPILTPTLSPMYTPNPNETKSGYNLSNDNSDNVDEVTDNILATELPIATLEPTRAPVVVNNQGDIVKFSFDDYVVDELILNGRANVGNVEITSDNNTITVNSASDTDFVEFTLTREGFRKLVNFGFGSIEVPYRTISIYQVYLQIQETNTDYAQFEWFFDGAQYRYKAVIKNNYLDWLRSFPHGERYLIIE